MLSVKVPRSPPTRTHPQSGRRAVATNQTKSVRTILQAKLRIGGIGDKYEREADAMSHQVMQRQAPGDSTTGCSKCRQTARHAVSASVQASSAGASGMAGIDAPTDVHRALSAPAKPLDQPTKTFFESRFGHDFSAVRIHTGTQAAAATDSIQARAFTVGSDVVFGNGEYSPRTSNGRHLLAHELTHVVQQTETSAQRQVQRLPFGIQLPSGIRFLDSTEEGILRGVYGGSLIYRRILLSNGLGGGGRPFTQYTGLPGLGGVTIIHIGSSAYNTPGSNRRLLIHEVAHSWQSQHHPVGAAYMLNSVQSQAGAAAAGASAYCYVPGKWFGMYAAEQIAEQAEDGIAAIRSHMRSTSAGSTDFANVASLSVPRWEKRGDPGVQC